VNFKTANRARSDRIVQFSPVHVAWQTCQAVESDAPGSDIERSVDENTKQMNEFENKTPKKMGMERLCIP
jgi:hypothetical protein